LSRAEEPLDAALLGTIQGSIKQVWVDGGSGDPD
jgi:hypothetical protein